MADYIFIRKSRNILSSLLHIILNLALAVVSIGITVMTGSCLIGLILVFISKWRVFAVNHRYWLVNLRASLVDFIVGFSFVLLAYCAGSTFLLVHFVLMVGYAIWLILIKPRSSPAFTIVQSIVAIVLGVTVASLFAAVTNSLVLTAASFVIGFATSYHVLIRGEDRDISFISLVFALFFSEIAWLAHSWLILYTIGDTGICLSQASLVLAVIAFAYFQVNRTIARRKNHFRFGDVALPVLFSILVIMVLVIGFSQPRFNMH